MYTMLCYAITHYTIPPLLIIESRSRGRPPDGRTTAASNTKI